MTCNSWGKSIVLPTGGATVIKATSPIGNDYIGRAVCSKDDNYNKKIGVKIALGRALKNATELRTP